MSDCKCDYCASKIHVEDIFKAIEKYYVRMFDVVDNQYCECECECEDHAYGVEDDCELCDVCKLFDILGDMMEFMASKKASMREKHGR